MKATHPGIRAGGLCISKPNRDGDALGDLRMSPTKLNSEITFLETCSAVERDPTKVSGAWVFSGTRVPLAALFENLRDGASVSEFLTWFPGVDRSQVEAVLDSEAHRCNYFKS
jgi:uncharacterized protein (DUF433 family)